MTSSSVQGKKKGKGGINMYFKGTGVFEGKKRKKYLEEARGLNLLPGPGIYKKTGFFFLGMSGT